MTRSLTINELLQKKLSAMMWHAEQVDHFAEQIKLHAAEGERIKAEFNEILATAPRGTYR